MKNNILHSLHVVAAALWVLAAVILLIAGLVNVPGTAAMIGTGLSLSMLAWHSILKNAAAGAPLWLWAWLALAGITGICMSLPGLMILSGLAEPFQLLPIPQETVVLLAFCCGLISAGITLLVSGGRPVRDAERRVLRAHVWPALIALPASLGLSGLLHSIHLSLSLDGAASILAGILMALFFLTGLSIPGLFLHKKAAPPVVAPLPEDSQS